MTLLPARRFFALYYALSGSGLHAAQFAGRRWGNAMAEPARSLFGILGAMTDAQRVNIKGYRSIPPSGALITLIRADRGPLQHLPGSGTPAKPTPICAVNRAGR